MKDKVLSVLLPLTMLTILFNGRSSNQGYLEILYAGDETKPYPILILYMPGTIDTIYYNDFTTKLEISEKGFEEIRKSIESIEIMSKDTLLISGYIFNFVRGGDTTVCLTPYLSRIRQIFQRIMKQFEGTSKFRVVNEILYGIISRLKADNRLN